MVVWKALLPRIPVIYRGTLPSLLAFKSTVCDSGKCQWPYEIYHSDRIQDRKSVFQAHASELKESSSLPVFLESLTSLPSLKRTTHCMYAYRSIEKDSLSRERVSCGQNDGGESGSGHRLSKLLELSKCENVVIVVSRWYGGVKLGSDRWKCISSVAKEALGKGGFLNRQKAPQEVLPRKKGERK